MENTNKTEPSSLVAKKNQVFLKKTELMIAELDLKREEEKRYQLTIQEQNKYNNLKDVFGNQQYPSADIDDALIDNSELKNIRKEYLAASQELIKKKKMKDDLNKDSVGLMLLASGTPISVIGAILMESFKAAGIGVIIAGITMVVPIFAKEFIQKKKTKKILKEIENEVQHLSDDIYKRSINIDKVCSRYGIPINCLEREKYLSPLLAAAKEYENYKQKEIDYELMIKLNGTEALSRQIADNLQKLFGIESQENEFHDVIEIAEKNDYYIEMEESGCGNA